MENDNDDSNSSQMMEEIYANDENNKTQRQRPIISSEQLDIESYASFYKGRTKILRLIFIADRCDIPSMQLEILRMAYDQAKKGEDSYLFKEVAQRINGRLGANYGMDLGWIEAVERRAEFRKEKLENEINAYRFLEVVPELGNNYSEVIAPQDVATYGGLCALATFDRSELKSKVIDNLNFRKFLELVPEIRELIHDFYSSHYASCLDYLGNLKTNLLLDIRLHDHVESLYKEIRHKALIQYTLPFVSVDLNMMANAFKTSVSGLQKELEALITNNQIQARIDSHNKILYARHADQRNATFQHVLQTGAGFDRDVRSMLLRANIIKHDFSHKHSRRI